MSDKHEEWNNEQRRSKHRELVRLIEEVGYVYYVSLDFEDIYKIEKCKVAYIKDIDKTIDWFHDFVIGMESCENGYFYEDELCIEDFLGNDPRYFIDYDLAVEKVVEIIAEEKQKVDRAFKKWHTELGRIRGNES